MKRYAYRQLRVYGGPGTMVYYQTGDFLSFKEGIAKKDISLEQLGREGWLLVSMIKDSAASAWYCAVFVRELVGEEGRDP